jgi:hypothetical protein
MMKRILTTLLFTLIFGSAAIAGNVIKTEYITEEVCEALAGCWIDPSTGDCPDCVEITRKIVTEVGEEKEKKVVKETFKKKMFVEPEKSNKKWTCIVGPCDDMIDENGNLIDS